MGVPASRASRRMAVVAGGFVSGYVSSSPCVLALALSLGMLGNAVWHL